MTRPPQHYLYAIDQFERTPRRKGESFSSLLERITDNQYVWDQVAQRAWGMAAGDWMDSFRTKKALVSEMRKPLEESRENRVTRDDLDLPFNPNILCVKCRKKVCG